MQDDITLQCDLRAFGSLKPAEHIVLHHDDVKAVNTEMNPDEVKPIKGRNGKMDGGKMNVKLPALSWNVIRLVP
jgi:alpha-N-arabinofuranosidase